MISSHSRIGLGSGELKIDRRHFLRLWSLASIALLLPRPLFASVRHLALKEKHLSLCNAYTREQIDISYFSQGRYLPEALEKINYILRDHRTGEIKPMDIRLLDLLHAISEEAQPNSPFQIVSGYRSPSTNAMLRRQRRGVAKNSLHMEGKAVDISLPDLSTASLRRIAAGMERGGVGYYPRLRFVHLDVGEIRYWRA